MSLARCPEPECQRVLDVPEIEASWRCPDGRCAACNKLSAQELKAMDIPGDVIAAVHNGVPREPRVHMKRSYQSRGEVSGNIEAGMPIPTPDSMPKIESNVPLPPKKVKVKKQPRYPFAKMRAPRSETDMDSFFVKLTKDTPSERSKLAGAISSCAYTYRKTNGLHIKFTVRCVDGGVRCWRTA